MLRALLALLFTAIAGVATAAVVPAPPGPDRVVLPIVDFVFGAPVVEVRLNGGPAHRFKFDSGSMELIAASKATAEGIQPTGVTKLIEINKTGTMPVSDTDVRLGEADLGPVSLALMPDTWNHPPRIDGMIGKTLLLRYVVTMDVPGRQIILTRPEAYEVPAGSVVLPMVELHGLFHVPAALDGDAGEFGLDTGLTSHVIVFPGFDQAHGVALRYGENATTGDAAGTSGVKVQVRQAKGEALTLGGGRSLPERPDPRRCLGRWEFRQHGRADRNARAGAIQCHLRRPAQPPRPRAGGGAGSGSATARGAALLGQKPLKALTETLHCRT